MNQSSFMSWDDGLPRPKWDLVGPWAESQGSPAATHEAWTGVGRHWLAELSTAFDDRYQTVESEHFLGLFPKSDSSGPYLLRFSEDCRSALSSLLGDVARFPDDGKTIILSMGDAEDYYQYVSHFVPDGEQGGSGGMHIREGYSHVVVNGQVPTARDTTLAHELTHVSLHHLEMPQWLEEGLAQTFEHDMAPRQAMVVDAEMAARHKKYWARNGLDEFWRGVGFSQSGKVQELSYQLAEILVRLLLEDGRPRWFGWVKEPQKKLFAFLKAARGHDCGGDACMTHLGYDLGTLAGKFLGPGDWSPRL